MRARPHTSRFTVATCTIAAALGAPAAQADWTAPKTLTRPPLHDAFAVDAAGNAKGVESFTWIHTTRTLRQDPNGRNGYLRYVRARTRLAHGALAPARTVSRKDVIVDAPLVGVDIRGTTTIVWQESRRGSKRPFVMVAVALKGKRFSAPLTLGRTHPAGDLVDRPALAVSPDGAAVVAWAQSGRMVAVRRGPGRCSSRSARRCFGSVQRLSGASEHPVGSPAATIGLDGRSYVAFTTDKPALRLATSRGRYRFSSSQRVSAVGEPAAQPSVAAGSDGAIVAWRRAGEDTAAEGKFGPILAATRNSAGQISPAQIVDATVAGRSPVVRVTSQSEAILVWSRDTQQGDQVLASSRPIAGSFGLAQLISPSGGPGRLAVDIYGNAAVAFSTPGGIAAVIRGPGGSFGAPENLAGARLQTFIAAARHFTAGWTTDDAVLFSDVTF